MKSVSRIILLSLGLLIGSCGVEPASSDLKVVGGDRVGPAITIDGESTGKTNPSHYTVKLSNAAGTSLCSGTLVLDGTYVVTASHCIDPVTGVTFVIFDQLNSSSTKTLVERVTTRIEGYGVINPGFIQRQKADAKRTLSMNTMHNIPTGDIALVKLFADKSEIPTYVRPLKWATKETTLEVGMTVRASGFGKTLRPDTGNEVSASANRFVIESAIEQAEQLEPGPQRYKLERMIDTHLNELHTLAAPVDGKLRTVELKLEEIQKRDAELISRSPDATWKSVCYGDSGGPSTATIDDEETLIGVNARIGNRRCIEDSKLVDIRRYNDWLIDFAKVQADKGADFFVERSKLELDGESQFVVRKKITIRK